MTVINPKLNSGILLEAYRELIVAKEKLNLALKREQESFDRIKRLMDIYNQEVDKELLVETVETKIHELLIHEAARK